MAQACARCGGVGFGYIDPDGETGWRSGSSKGQPPVPCPDCVGRFEKYEKTPGAKIQRVDKNDGKIERSNPLEYGRFIDPQRVKVKKQTIQVIDGDERSISEEPFDPGVVETGNAKVTIEEALASTASEAGEE